MLASRMGVGLLVAASMIGLGLVSGCGSSSGTASVSGQVMYNGQPLTTGEINFIPTSPEVARGGFASLDEQGRYALGTFEPGDGAFPGKYKVTVTARGPDKPIPAAKKGQMMEEDTQGSGDPLIPTRYFTPMTSGLEAEVVAGQSNTFDFDLKD